MTRMIRRVLSFALAAIMLAALLPSAISGKTAQADSSLGIVILDEVNFRVGPSMKDKMLFKLRKGTVCPVLTRLTANGYDWYEVTARDPDNGREFTGYIRGDCFRMMTDQEAAGQSGSGGGTVPVATPVPAGSSSAVKDNVPAPANAVGTVNDWGVNLRMVPWGSVITRLDQGVQVRVLTVPPARTRQYWYQVEYQGQQGYIMASYLDYSGKTAAPTATPAPGTPTATPAPGEPTATPPGGIITPTPSGSDILGYVMTIKGSVNIRASIGGTSLTQVGIWQTFPYLLAPVRRGSYTWYFIQLKSGLKGYIRGDCVKLVSAPDVTPAPVITAPPGGTTPTPSPVTPVEDTPSGYVKTTIDNVNVRKGVWGDLITVVKKAGTVFPYYGEPRISGNTRWYFIKSDTFGYAYIHGGFVTETDGGGSSVTPAPVITPEPGTTPDPSITPKPGGPRNEASYTTLRPGSSGAAVLNLVRELINQGYYKGAETNRYTSAVENAVRAFQTAKGLAVDGIAGNNTQHALFNTVPIGSSDYSTDPSMTFYPAEKIDWYTGGIDELWPRGGNFMIYDVKTGITWWAHRWSGGLHVDAEPLTAADTQRLCKIYSLDTGKTITDAQQIADMDLYERRPCLITIGTRTFACSLYGVPHNYPDGDTISDNNFRGQVCIHFTNSKTHDSRRVDTEHQAAIQYAWENAPNGHK